MHIIYNYFISTHCGVTVESTQTHKTMQSFQQKWKKKDSDTSCVKQKFPEKLQKAEILLILI